MQILDTPLLTDHIAVRRGSSRANHKLENHSNFNEARETDCNALLIHFWEGRFGTVLRA